jgi:hypothetical protein
VHLQARINEEMYLVSLEQPDDRPKKERVSEDTPPPAHMIV